MNTKFPSLCIPRVFLNIDENQIRNIFDELNIGIIHRIDIVKKTTEKGEKFNRVFIHFACWFETENALIARNRLLDGKEIKIIYDEPWFWKVSAYRETTKSHKKPRQEEPHQPKKNYIKQGEIDLKKMLGLTDSSEQNVDETAGQRLLRAITNN